MASSAHRVSEQSQVGYQGPGEPENIQRVERRAVREDYFCSGMEDPLNIVLNLNQNSVFALFCSQNLDFIRENSTT